VGDHRSGIQAYTDGLVGILAERGVDWIDWRVDGGHLQLDLHPQDAFPFQIRVAPRGNDTNCFVDGELAGAFYMTNSTVELDKPVVKEIRALCEAILDALDSAVVESVRSYAADDWSRITRVDQIAMLQGGHINAAVITAEDRPDTLERLRAEVPAALFADDEFNAHFQARNPTAADDVARRPVYIGTDTATVQRLSALDKILHISGDPAGKAAAILEVAILFGTPKCCAKVYAAHLAAPSNELDQVAFLRHVERWAGDPAREGLPPIHPRLTNFLAARSHQITFIDYWPCSPDCEETIYRNRRMLADLYDDDDRRIVEEILGTSYLGWTDGRLAPFRIEAVEGSELRVVDGRKAPWSGLALDRYRSQYCRKIPGGGRAADLRRLGRKGKGWRWNDGSQWRRVRGEGGWLRQRPPLVALFGDA
jgi:hypothetical protein